MPAHRSPLDRIAALEAQVQQLQAALFALKHSAEATQSSPTQAGRGLEPLNIPEWSLIDTYNRSPDLLHLYAVEVNLTDEHRFSLQSPGLWWIVSLNSDLDCVLPNPQRQQRFLQSSNWQSVYEGPYELENYFSLIRPAYLTRLKVGETWYLQASDRGLLDHHPAPRQNWQNQTNNLRRRLAVLEGRLERQTQQEEFRN
ncbi:hypothetical protein VZG28_08080 [Synechococcus elongatus IITB4]|uniref:hypothetical protein n=1 Tax=Synechococcus elongatus TaxID=32046 RepID=UPI0030CE85DE